MGHRPTDTQNPRTEKMRFFNNIKWCRSREARTGRDRTCRVGLGCEILEPRQLLAITAPVLDSEAETQVEVSQESLDQIIPVLDSLPGAPKTLYLDFDGHDGVWEGQPAHTPQFSLDDDRNNFSPQEIAAMEEIWQRVAEDYSPFNINVSTVEPPELAEGASVYDAIGVSVRVAIGGDWTQWLGEEASGIALRGSFYNGSPNTVYAFDRKILCEDPADCGVFTPRYIADVVSHEAAHSFGLKHQSYWGQSDIRGYHMVHEYHPGNSELVPIMGGAAKAGPGPRSVWWVGTNQNDKPQNDIASLLSNLGERPDDHKDRSSEATVISLQNPTKGVITFGTGEAPDVDMFVVSVPAGLGEQLNIAVHVNPVGPNLDARLEVYTAYSRGPIAVDDPENSLNASVSVPLGETYWIKVMGHRAADPLTDMGQYTLNFSVQPFVFDFITKNDPFETICDPLAP